MWNTVGNKKIPQLCFLTAVTLRVRSGAPWGSLEVLQVALKRSLHLKQIKKSRHQLS